MVEYFIYIDVARKELIINGIPIKDLNMICSLQGKLLFNGKGKKIKW